MRSYAAPAANEVSSDRPARYTLSVQISILPAKAGGETANSPENLKKKAEEIGERALASSKEKTLSLQELKGAEATGYFYTVADKDPAPGSFEYMTGGIEGVGDLFLIVTILHHTKDAPERQAALDMLKGARQSKDAAGAQSAHLRVSAPAAA